MFAAKDDIRQLLAQLQSRQHSDGGQHRQVLTCMVNEDKGMALLYAPSTDLRDVIDRWCEDPIGRQEKPVALSVEEAVNEIWGKVSVINRHGYHIELQ